jgi:hypothetical protein
VDLVRRLSDEGNEPRAEFICGPELSRRVTAGDHFEIAVIYGEEIEVGEPCERLDDLRDYALVACVDRVPEVGHLRDQLRDVVGLLVNRQQSCLCFVAGLGRGMHALHSNMDVVKAYAASVRAGTRVSRRQAVLFLVGIVSVMTRRGRCVVASPGPPSDDGWSGRLTT